MKNDRVLVARILLVLGGIYYLLGAVAHFFGLTVFPLYDSALYTPYHDTVIALVAIFLTIILWTIARDPVKNLDTYKAIIIGGILAIIFSMGIILKIDFTALHAPGKRMQTIVEMILLIIYTTLLFVFRPTKAK